MTPYEKVVFNRNKVRQASDYIKNIFTDFFEMHGDRRYGDDPAIISGIAKLGDISVTVIAQEKGADLKEKQTRNYGMAHPEGYRKALRQMKLAEKFGRPIICFVDTSGAFCGLGAEERGQGQAIAENLLEMSNLKVPIIAIVIGEGGSGGALGIALADEIWMLENAVYSVISPEGCASILWKDSKRAAEAATSLKLTAEDLLGFNVIEKIIPDNDDVFNGIKVMLNQTLLKFSMMNVEQLLENRYNKFKSIK
ncbi:MAG: acetyl-CoA carboxylase carboxyl transferase subunit alpha [Firmicutes bacterium]|nr:acetyl-CoA carboxylase carboxyl transferase subunit alpha [Bacillota bacterium]